MAIIRYMHWDNWGMACTNGLWVGDGPQPVVVLLPGRIPQSQADWFPVHHHIGCVYVEPGNQHSTLRKAVFYGFII